MITDDEVFLQLWIFDELKFHMAFDANFVEVDRSTGLYYDWKFMEEVYAYKFSKEKDDKLMLSNMLRSRPVTLGFDPKSVAFWDKMVPMTPEFATSFWGRTNVSQAEPMIDWDNLEYAEW
jgi:hypothetical protein